MTRFDTHVHLWRHGDGNPVRIRERVPALDADFTLDRLLPDLMAAEISRLVLVSAAQNEREPLDLLATARQHPELVAGVIGWFDPGDPAFDHKVAALAADPLWLGIRLPIVLEDADAFVRRPGIDAALARLAAADAVVQILVNPAQLAPVVTLLERHPGLRVVLDHAANPDVFQSVDAVWRDGIRRFARLPAASCKLSAFWLPGGPVPSEEQIRPFIEDVLEAFGDRRVVAASNWPVSALWLPPHRIFVMLERISGLSPAILYDNAARLYRRATTTR